MCHLLYKMINNFKILFIFTHFFDLLIKSCCARRVPPEVPVSPVGDSSAFRKHTILKCTVGIGCVLLNRVW